MPEFDPQVMLRIGSHSEKEYIEKTLKHFDGVIVGANLLQATPGATASLILKLNKQSKRPYFVDPMTYAFGMYVDPQTGGLRSDLDWIKSDQKVRGGRKGQTKRDFKSSYRKLADVFGPPFSDALNRSIALTASDFASEAVIDLACKSILDFQANRLREVFREDPETRPFAEELPTPAALFAPYFYVEKSRSEEWIELNRRLAISAAKQSATSPVHIVVCGHGDLLTDETMSERVMNDLKECRPAGVWLWFSRFDEHAATKGELSALRRWVEELSPSMAVFNKHGSFFSLALSKVGMTGIAHGIGYGEQKDVVPVIGQSTPTVQYYVRPLHAKYSVPRVNRCFSSLGIRTSQDFFEKICDCVVCQGIIGPNLSAFSQFGEIHYSTPTSRRAAQTPAAAKRCRFHFLLNRIKEREYIRKTNLADIAKDCLKTADAWLKPLGAPEIEHLKVWGEVLGS